MERNVLSNKSIENWLVEPNMYDNMLLLSVNYGAVGISKNVVAPAEGRWSTQTWWASIFNKELMHYYYLSPRKSN